MKKIFLLLNIFALCFLASCNPNEYAKFDDKDAFVAFGGATYSINENGGVLEVPVTLASVKGIETMLKLDSIIIANSSIMPYNYGILIGVNAISGTRVDFFEIGLFAKYVNY